MARTPPSRPPARPRCSSARSESQETVLGLVLASRSPQRREILARLGVEFTVRVSDASELTEGDPAEVTVENALRKARAVAYAAEAGGEVIIGCDTVVSLNGAIYGKPSDEGHARNTLQALSGCTHVVVSGLALLAGGEERTVVARTKVAFRSLEPALLDWYVGLGEWRERAGGYAIQGAGTALVRTVTGDYENVVGLPLASLLDVYPELIAR